MITNEDYKLIDLTKKLLDMDFFEMCDHRFIIDDDLSMLHALPDDAFAVYSLKPSDALLLSVAQHMLSEMRREYPEAILVCHL